MSRGLIIAQILIWSGVTLFAEKGYRIEEATLFPSTSIRVQVVAESMDIVRNPANHTQVIEVVPEGSQVNAGDQLARFDMTISLEELRKARNDEETKRLTYSNEVAKISENLLQLENELAKAKDELAVLEAQRDYQRSLPLEDEVTISRGRLEIAEKNAQAVQKDLERAQERFDRGMISPRALKKVERDADDTQALLSFAEREHRYVGLSASSNTLRILDLKIENANLTIDRLNEELATRKDIADIQRTAAETEAALRQQRVTELEEDNAQSVLQAERDATVLYTRQFKRRLTAGEKARKSEGLFELPNLDSLVLQGSIRDEHRGFFAVGDPAIIHLNTDRTQPIEGKIKFISPLPRDISETSRALWGEQESQSGIKVFNLFIEVDPEAASSLKLGTYGEAELSTLNPLIGPVVPLPYVTSTPDGFYLSRKGTLTPVEGQVMQGVLVLDDPSWLGEKISWAGAFPDTDADELSSETDSLVSSGELIPLTSVAVFTPRMRVWGIKIKSLIPENNRIDAGETLIELESEALEKRRKDLEARLAAAESKRASDEEKQQIEKRNRTFKLKEAKNILEIRQLEQEITERGIDFDQLNKAQLSVEQATIDFDFLTDELAWATNRAENFAPAELERMKRDLERQRLKLEAAELDLTLAEQGANPLQRSKAEHATAIQQARVDEITQDLGLSSFGASRRLQRSRDQERRLRQQLTQVEKNEARLIVPAPVSGLVTYEKIWDGIGVSKINVGYSVWPGTHLVSIADTSQMYVRIPVAEHYFNQVSEGMSVDVVIPSIAKEKFSGEITQIEFLLNRREQSNPEVGLYGSHEPTGAQVFYAHVTLENPRELELKAGATAHVIFPFQR